MTADEDKRDVKANNNDFQQEFHIVSGGGINDFEIALHSIVEDAPILLAEMKSKMAAKGFSWVGKPKSTINSLNPLS